MITEKRIAGATRRDPGMGVRTKSAMSRDVNKGEGQALGQTTYLTKPA
jgi:hypothetical protein